MGCIEELEHEILLSGASFQECRQYVEKHIREVRYVNPGFRIFDEYIIGVPPIAIGIEGTAVILPYTKPCHGTFLLRINSRDEAARLLALKKGPARR